MTCWSHEVAPRFYERDTDGVPHPWVAMMKSAIVGAAAPFSAQRMVAQYVNELYSKTSSPTTVGGETTGAAPQTPRCDNRGRCPWVDGVFG